MCVILASINGKEIKKEDLETGFISNPHGSGYMVAKDGELIINKGFFSFEKFYEDYQKYIGYPIVIHHRWATTGKRNKENCHPFQFLNGEFDNKLSAAFAHNGHIYGHTEIVGASDTYNFCMKRLVPLSKDSNGEPWWRNNGFRWMLKEAIGKGNKLVFLDNEGNVEIYNEEIGEWVEEGEIWASNDSYKNKKYRQEKVGCEFYDDEYSKHQKELKKQQEALNPKSNIIEADFAYEHHGSPASSTLPHKPYTIDDKITTTIWDVSEEELNEIDNYLEQLNTD